MGGKDMTDRREEETNEDVLLSVRNLEKHYPVEKGILGREVGVVRAVDGVSFDVCRGDAFGVVGESGCGKSTLAHTLLRLEEPTGGAVFFDGDDVTEYDEAELRSFRRKAQVIFQDPDSSFDPRMSVGNSIEEPLRVQGMSDPDRRRSIVADLLERVGLSAEDARRYPHELSGGQKQRVGLARALSVNPDLLVADEPVSALDVSTQAEILSLIDDLRADYGLTVIVISHDISVVEAVCDRVGVMYVGEMVEKGPAGAVLDEPAHPYTRALLESVPTPYPSSGGPSAPLEGEVPDPANPPSGCRFHPRCPEVIPSDTGVNSDELAAVIRFRSRLSDSPGAVVETARSADDAEEAREALGLPRPDEATAERALGDAVDSLIEGNAEEAFETLSEEFGTPCESEGPPDYTADGSEEHVASCLLHDERFEG